MKHVFFAALLLVGATAHAVNIETGLPDSKPTSDTSGSWTWTSGGSNFEQGSSNYGGNTIQSDEKAGVWSYDYGGGDAQTPAVGGDYGQSPSIGGGNAQTPGVGGGNGQTPGVGGGNGQAQGKPELSIRGVVNWMLGIFQSLAFLLLGAALLSFLYGIVVLMFVGGSNEESRSKGRRFMLWGIISLFVMVSVWGLVNVLKVSVFGGTNLIIPQLK